MLSSGGGHELLHEEKLKGPPNIGDVVYYKWGSSVKKYGTVKRVTGGLRVWCIDWGEDEPSLHPNQYETYMPLERLYLVTPALPEEEIWE